jgi:hypothetical protein
MGEENGIHRFDVERKGNKTTGQVKEKKTKFKQMIVMLHNKTKEGERYNIHNVARQDW